MGCSYLDFIPNAMNLDSCVGSYACAWNYSLAYSRLVGDVKRVRTTFCLFAVLKVFQHILVFGIWCIPSGANTPRLAWETEHSSRPILVFHVRINVFEFASPAEFRGEGDRDRLRNNMRIYYSRARCWEMRAIEKHLHRFGDTFDYGVIEIKPRLASIHVCMYPVPSRSVSLRGG